MKPGRILGDLCATITKGGKETYWVPNLAYLYKNDDEYESRTGKITSKYKYEISFIMFSCLVRK